MNEMITEQDPDSLLISKILNGETEAFVGIVKEYNGYLYKLGRAYGYEHEDTEDLMQETYVNTYQNLGKFEHRAAFKTWLTQIMLHACYHKRHLVKTRKEFTFPEYIPNEKNQPMFSDHQDDTGQKVDNNELTHNLEEAILHIPEAYRMVFTLRELNGLSVKETAEALDLSESNVKVRFHRAKDMLQKELLKTYKPEDIFEFNLIHCDPMVERVMNVVRKLNPDWK